MLTQSHAMTITTPTDGPKLWLFKSVSPELSMIQRPLGKPPSNRRFRVPHVMVTSPRLPVYRAVSTRPLDPRSRVSIRVTGPTSLCCRTEPSHLRPCPCTGPTKQVSTARRWLTPCLGWRIQNVGTCSSIGFELSGPRSVGNPLHHRVLTLPPH